MNETRPVRSVSIPGAWYQGRLQEIPVEIPGICDLIYVKVRNPELQNLMMVDHCYFDWEAYPSIIDANQLFLCV